MIIAIGSTNVVKVQAVIEVVKGYSLFALCTVKTFTVASGVSEQPLTLEEIILGAKNRARNAYESCENCEFSFGMESGLFEAKGTQTGYLETCICAIYDGSNYFIGMSCGIEIPFQILKLILEKKFDLSRACYESGITTNVNLGSAEGLFGILTNNRINRKEYTKQGIITAMCQLENARFYQMKSNVIDNLNTEV